MFMRYRGGGVGHSSTRDATNRFLLDRHPLDLSNDDGDIEDEGSERENAGGDDNNDDDDQSSEGSVQGDGTGGNQADDYGYERPAEEDNESELVLDMGNPRVKFTLSLPIPVNTRTHDTWVRVLAGFRLGTGKGI